MLSIHLSTLIMFSLSLNKVEKKNSHHMIASKYTYCKCVFSNRNKNQKLVSAVHGHILRNGRT